jgi:hypothetical protein
VIDKSIGRSIGLAVMMTTTLQKVDRSIGRSAQVDCSIGPRVGRPVDRSLDRFGEDKAIDRSIGRSRVVWSNDRPIDRSVGRPTEERLVDRSIDRSTAGRSRGPVGRPIDRATNRPQSPQQNLGYRPIDPHSRQKINYPCFTPLAVAVQERPRLGYGGLAASTGVRVKPPLPFAKFCDRFRPSAEFHEEPAFRPVFPPR